MQPHRCLSRRSSPIPTLAAGSSSLPTASGSTQPASLCAQQMSQLAAESLFAGLRRLQVRSMGGLTPSWKMVYEKSIKAALLACTVL